MPFRPQRLLALVGNDEDVYLVTRKHWFILFLRVSVWLVFIILLMFVDGLAKQYFPALAVGRAAVAVGIIRTCLLMLSLLGLFMVWALYYLNVQVVTNRRIVDIDQKSLLKHETSELTLENIEDVTAQIHGPIANLLDFGDVIVQTAGEKVRFVFDDIPHPHEMARYILNLYERVVTKHRKPGND